MALLAGCLLAVRPVWLGGSLGYTIVSGASMQPTLASGDLVVTRARGSYARGDVVVYAVPRGQVGAGAQVVHRIAGGSPRAGFLTRGDAKRAPDPWRPREDDVVGEVVLHVPSAGTALLWLRTGLGLAVVAALVTFLVALAASRESRPASSP